MSIVKAFRFPASTHWQGGRRARASAPGKPTLEVGVPPEFKGVVGVWSPEELLVAAASSCFTVTFAAVAERAGVELRAIDVDGVAHVERAEDRRFRVTVVELAVDVDANAPAHVIQGVLAETKRLCIVTLALEVPVRVRLVEEPAPAAAFSR